MHACTHIHIHVRMYTRAHICSLHMYTCMHIYVTRIIYMHAWAYITHTCTHTHMYSHTYKHAYMDIHNTHMRSHSHAFTHTFIHFYEYICSSSHHVRKKCTPAHIYADMSACICGRMYCIYMYTCMYVHVALKYAKLQIHKYRYTHSYIF